MNQSSLIEPTKRGLRLYSSVLTASENMKGVLDVDTVKGCTLGMNADPRGCYGECYANKIAERYGIDFTVSVSRRLTPYNFDSIFKTVRDHQANWYRIGTAGEPCHDWENTLSVIEALHPTGKTAVIITKHWIPLLDTQIWRLRAVSAVVNTSTSGLDTEAQTKHRIGQIMRLREAGVDSVCRVVTCEYGSSEWAQTAKRTQDYLLSLAPVIDNPLRATAAHHRVQSGEIILSKRIDAIGGGKAVSLHNQDVYLGTCEACPDQCGLFKKGTQSADSSIFNGQRSLFGEAEEGQGREA